MKLYHISTDALQVSTRQNSVEHMDEPKLRNPLFHHIQILLQASDNRQASGLCRVK